MSLKTATKNPPQVFGVGVAPAPAPAPALSDDEAAVTMAAGRDFTFWNEKICHVSVGTRIQKGDWT
jgi:hypothetical protein